MENKLPSKSKVEEIMDRWDRENPMFFSLPRDPEDETQDDKDRETFRQVLRAYVDGKLIEPLSREEIHELLYRVNMVSVNVKDMKKAVDIVLGQVGKVQEDISNSMLRRFRVQHGLDLVTGKPHVELTEEEVFNIVRRWAFKNKAFSFETDVTLTTIIQLAQEIVRRKNDDR